MAHNRLFLIAFLLSITFVKAVAQDSYDSRVFTPAQMQEDFDTLRHTLENTHPGLYKHTDKATMQYKMDSLRNLLDQPMPFYRFYQVVATLITEVKCEHTSCEPYVHAQLMQHLQQWKLIPLVMQFNHDKAYVVVNRTRDTSIHLGDEVFMINHRRVDSLEHALFQYVPTEGDMITPKIDFLSTAMNFNSWYAMFISRPDSFDIVFRSPDGKIKERVWKDSLTLAESTINTLKNPANKRIIEAVKKSQRENENPWRLHIAANKQYAIMTINGFGKGSKKAQTKMSKTFAAFFAKLKRDKIPNLIINIASNPGGDEANAAELFSYLISEPGHFINDEYLITNNDYYLKKADIPADMLQNKDKYLYPEKNGKYYVREETQGELPICQPKADRFIGKLYFYISGHTASAASTFAAVAQSNHLGIFIGEETGGTYFGGGSSVGINLILPNSGITTHTSINYCDFATKGDHNPNRGVMPDYPYVPTFAEILNKGDKAWEDYIIKLMPPRN